MKATVVYGNKVLNYDECTPEERKQFYDSIIISNEQARQIAWDIYHSDVFVEFINQKQAKTDDEKTTK